MRQTFATAGMTRVRAPSVDPDKARCRSACRKHLNHSARQDLPSGDIQESHRRVTVFRDYRNIAN